MRMEKQGYESVFIWGFDVKRLHSYSVPIEGGVPMSTNKRGLVALVLSLGLLAVASASALADGERWTFTDLSAQQIEDILDTLGDMITYESDTDGAGDPMWRISITESGLNFSLYVYDDDEGDPDNYESLLVRSGFGMSSPPTIWTVNGYNQGKRFCRAFLNEDGDPIVEADLDVGGGVTDETITRFLLRFMLSVKSFASWIGYQ